MAAGERNRAIDLLRGVAIGLVLLHHFNIAYSLADTWPAHVLGWPAVRAVMRNGNYGVTMFFVMSGYLITSNALSRWQKPGRIDALAFYRMRAARILPCAVFLAITVDLLAFASIAIFQNHPEMGGPVPLWVTDLAGLTFWMNVLVAHAGWLNYVLAVQWSLSVEEVFYLAFPVLCLSLRRDSRLVLVWCIFIVLGPIWRQAHQDDEAQFLYAYLACFDGIAIGCCTAVLARRFTIGLRWSRVLGLVSIATMAVVYLARSIAETNVWGVSVMALGTAGLILSTLPRAAEAPRRRGIAVWPLLACGRLSYELYLFHLLILGGLRSVFPPDDISGNTKLLLMVLYCLSSFGLAAVVSRCFAEPANRFIRGDVRVRQRIPS
jgi:peptidoglycan/LPS O-acetylase OafA/YrhL